MKQFVREPINGFTHLAGAILACIGLIALVIKASITTQSALAITAVTIFGISMILLYSASATYHMIIARDKVISILRRLDHSMIFILIMGTYTPFSLISLQGTTGWILFSIVVSIATFGVLFKMVWFHCPRWLSTMLYIAMGWIAVFFMSPLAAKLTFNGVMLLVFGGVIYTIGGVIYWLKPNFLNFKHLGFHEIFHIFILLGSLAHYFCIYYFVL
ncbi:hemolysin III family protein [Bacillus sp. HMF5848]|uniref:PAQR family membrane homeostasis protein TrhA n=1 Tax=Bacillus sp. HMF5848 TaxID=2495421 RepID=UPI000F779320|nr:hemolysin III family protein [Bacillus sp. HMF5848]RSK29472.1 hemolysin III family protein [Bacillus sp. HMF5848]